MSDPALLGLPATFRFEGVDYSIQDPRDFAVEASFCAFVEREAYLLVQRHRETMSPWDYRQHMDGWRRDGAAGLYAWEEQLCEWARLSEKGMKHLCLLQMLRVEELARERRQGAGHAGPPLPGAAPAPEITPELVDRIWRDREKREEMIAILREEKRRPPAAVPTQAPASGAGAGPSLSPTSSPASKSAATGGTSSAS